MQNLPLKLAFAVLVVLLAVMFIWKPLTLPFSGAVTTNDFVLQASQGPLDTKTLRGNVLAVVFGHRDCQETCAGYIRRLSQGYALLSALEREKVRLILVAAHPEKDSLEQITAYAHGLHPDFLAVTGKSEDIQLVADGFGSIIRKGTLSDGTPTVGVTPMVFVVDAEGRFTSVLNENLRPEDIAQSLRARISTQPPSGR